MCVCVYVCLSCVSDSAIFDVLPESKDQLRCAINVSQDPGLNLSMYHNGVPIDTRRNDTLFSPFRQLSVYIPLKEAGNYECKLNLASKLILNRNYSYYPGSVFLYYIYFDHINFWALLRTGGGGGLLVARHLTLIL